MTKDILERLQMVADIEDASSIPPEFLDNAFFKKIMIDAIAEITGLRFDLRWYKDKWNQPVPTPATYSPATDWGMYTGSPVTTGIGTQTTTNTPMPYTTYPVPTSAAPTLAASQQYQQALGALGWKTPQHIAQTMIYSEMDKNRLADQAVERAMEQAAAKDEPPPTVEEKDRLWDLIKSSVEGGG